MQLVFLIFLGSSSNQAKDHLAVYLTLKHVKFNVRSNVIWFDNPILYNKYQGKSRTRTLNLSVIILTMVWRQPDIPVELAMEYQTAVPKSYRSEIISLAHHTSLLGYLGVNKTYHKIINDSYWPELQWCSDVAEFVHLITQVSSMEVGIWRYIPLMINCSESGGIGSNTESPWLRWSVHLPVFMDQLCESHTWVPCMDASLLFGWLWIPQTIN